MIPEGSDAQIASLRLPAELDQLPAFLDYVRQIAQTAGLAAAQATRLELAVEEALVNVFNYAYAGWDQPGAVTCRAVVEGDGLTVEIIDEGPSFNPLAQPDPDTALSLEQRQPGGLGVFMIRRLTDEISYRREENWNVLTIRMRKGS